MTEETTAPTTNFIELAGDIVAAYVSNNPVPAAELPALIARVYGAIAGLAAGTLRPETGVAAHQADPDRPSAAQIRKSVRSDGNVSFIDGKTYKTPKRHLTSHGLDPRGHLDRYGLPADYPMVATSYAQQRAALAKASGLGQPGAMAEPQRQLRRAA
ncbi:MucR family transcriptional regulator [Methylobacterium sp. J-026]|uniref:MucR family transcriptional regulator n=1 Tax=Methylobacterium sp. J-026 TaxID=2836624 RepID=UPI001FB98187|nr:MucR family transcriptional regulator [Methylobacterium sp. J-026]MCJ2134809.1 MucR family transcriptional regulator [Methylobacterium sp. J-026]